MTLEPQPRKVKPVQVQDRLTSRYCSGDALRSRNVSHVVLCSTLDVPVPCARLSTDWDREISRVNLEPGDVEALSLPRARVRWPDYNSCVQAVAEWTRQVGLPDVLANSNVALMACRGARYHHDGAQYGGVAFCNLFLSEDKGLDLHFPATGHRIPLTRGTVVIFDTGQPHAVVRRNSSGFHDDDFAPEVDCSQLFLTWELSIEDAHIARALAIDFSSDASALLLASEEGVFLNGACVEVCPNTGQWLCSDESARLAESLPAGLLDRHLLFKN